MKRGNFGERVAHCKVQELSAVNCAETAEPFDLPFRLCTRVGRRKQELGWLWTLVRRRKHKFNHIRRVAPMCPGGTFASPGEYD